MLKEPKIYIRGLECLKSNSSMLTTNAQLEFIEEVKFDDEFEHKEMICHCCNNSENYFIKNGKDEDWIIEKVSGEWYCFCGKDCLKKIKDKIK